jgi:hypothetical protein
MLDSLDFRQKKLEIREKNVKTVSRRQFFLNFGDPLVF